MMNILLLDRKGLLEDYVYSIMYVAFGVLLNTTKSCYINSYTKEWKLKIFPIFPTQSIFVLYLKIITSP